MQGWPRYAFQKLQKWKLEEVFWERLENTITKNWNIQKTNSLAHKKTHALPKTTQEMDLEWKFMPIYKSPLKIKSQWRYAFMMLTR